MAETGFTHLRFDDSEETRKRQRHLGIARDAAGIASKGVTWGFGIARCATNFGFGVASTCLHKPAQFLEQSTGANPISSSLKGIDSALGVVHKVTTSCQDAAEVITQVSLDATRAGLRSAGAEDNALMRTALGEETAEAMTIIESMVTRYTRELAHIPPQQMLSAATTWGALQRASMSTRQGSREIAALPENSERWMRFAAATFGSTWLAGLVEGFSLSAASRASAIREQGGSSGDCAIAAAGLDGRIEVIEFEERKTEVYVPGYLVAVDHSAGCVVVALRGTSCLVDALTDLVCEAVPVQLGGVDGLAHGGMLRAAHSLSTKLSPLVESGLSRLPAGSPGRIVLCGHSLGAGVAALLAALWRDHAYLPGVDIQCFAFACPQVLDSVLATAQSNHTVSMIVGDDMVPRLSLATAQDFQGVLLCLNDPASRGLPPMLNSQISEAQSQGDTDRLAAAYTSIRPLVCTSSGRLFPSGRLIHFQPGEAPSTIATADVDELIVSSDMGSAHMPWRYFQAVQTIAMS